MLTAQILVFCSSVFLAFVKLIHSDVSECILSWRNLFPGLVHTLSCVLL